MLTQRCRLQYPAAEDNPAAVVQIEDALREYGAVISTAANAWRFEAWERLSGCGHFDLNLPEMDGFEFWKNCARDLLYTKADPQRAR